MKRPRTMGFTIVEVMIVLAVTGGLFVAIVATMSGRQGKSQFQEAIHNVQSQIQQTISEVSNGFYPNMNNFQCDSTGGGINIRGGSAAQGTNGDCVFLGKALQFKVGSADPEQFSTYAIAGLRTATTFSAADPTVIAPASDGSHGSVPNDSVDNILLNGLSVQWMRYNDGSNHNIGTVAFMMELGSLNGGGDYQSGAQPVELVPVPASSLGQSKSAAAAVMDSRLKASPVNPSGGVQICFQSGTTQQSGLVTIGGSGRQLSVKLDIKGTTDCS